MESGYRIKNVVKLILSLWIYKKEVGITLASVLLKHISTLGAALCAARMASLGVTGQLSPYFAKMFVFLCICVILRGVAYFGEMREGHDAAYKIQRDKRVAIYEKFEEISPAYMSRRHSGHVASAAMGDIELLEWFLAHTFGSLIVSVLFTLALAFMLATINTTLAVLVILFALLIGFAPQVFYKISDQKGTNVRKNNAIANGIIMEGIQGLRDIMALDYLDGYKRKNRCAIDNLYQSQIDYAKLNGIERGVMTFFSGAFTCLIMLLTSRFIIQGIMERAMYPQAIVLSLLIFSPIIELTTYARNLGITFAAASRIQGILDEKPVVEDMGCVKDSEITSHEITFENVSFAYDKEGEQVLKNVSFQIPVGKTVALVGPSGTGKTTCVNLLLRYWDPDKGAIYIGNENIKNLQLDRLHNMISAVLQDVFLFHTSIKENIRLGKKDATMEEIIQAAKMANAHEFICGLPDGYDTVTGERGFRLSGGQRQRISIARAMLQNAPILVLDEAVSSLDAENEQLIQQVLNEHAHNRTTLVIAHRLSTILNADMLVVVKDGEIVQTGTHQELINTPGFYSELMKKQL